MPKGSAMNATLIHLLLEHVLDVVGVLLVDLAALQLHSRSQNAVLRRPLVGVHTHLLDVLEGPAAVRDGGLLKALDDFGAEFLRGQDRRELALELVLLRKGHRLLLVRQHERADERRHGVHDDADAVGHHEVVAGVDRLEGLHRDVLAVRVLGQRLHAPDDLERAVLLPLADVARREPAVLAEHLGGLLGLLEVALRDARAADAHLALLRLRRRRPVGGVAELDLGGGLQTTRVLLLDVPVALDGAHGTCFGQAVALPDGAAEHDGHELVRSTVKGGAARNNHLDLPAEHAAGHGEDLAVPERRVVAVFEGLLAVTNSAFEQSALQGADGGQLAVDGLLDCIEDARDASEHRGLELAQVTVRLGRRVRQRAGVAVADTAAASEEDIFGGELKDVGEGEVGHVGLVGQRRRTGRGHQAAVECLHGGHEVLVRHDDALGVARRAARVHDEGDVAGGGRLDGRGVRLEQVREGNDLHA
eukprot:PhM_4_TR15935/c0_g2_i4/m.241